MDNGFNSSSMDTNMQCPTPSGLPHKKEVNKVAFKVINQSIAYVVEAIVDDYVMMNTIDTKKT